MDSYLYMYLVTTSRLPGIPDIKLMFLWQLAILGTYSVVSLFSSENHVDV